MSESDNNQHLVTQSSLFDARKHVRLRPGMYLGGIDAKALHLLLWQVIDELSDEIMSGRGNQITITMLPNNKVRVSNNGDGIPIYLVESSGRSFLEHYMTRNAGHNGRRKNGEYGLARSSFEVGISHVSALCTDCRVEVKREGFLWQQSYEEGIPTSEVEQIRPLLEGEATGTTIIFAPDFTIFEPNSLDYNAIVERVDDLAYCVPKLQVNITDERQNPSTAKRIKYENGIADLVTGLNTNRRNLHEVIYYKGNCIFEKRGYQRKFEVEFAMQFSDSMETTISSFVNGLRVEDGIHIKGMCAAISDFINSLGANNHDKTFSWEEICAGLTIALQVKHSDPHFDNQDRLNLVNPEVYGATSGIVYCGMNAANNVIYPQTVSNTFEAIIEKCEANRRALRGG